MSIYTKLLQAGLLPEFINCEQAMIVVDSICHECFMAAIDNHIVNVKVNDNGDILINTVSLLEFAEQKDENYIQKCRQDRLKYLMELNEGEIE